MKTLFFNFVFSTLDLPNVLYVYIMHYRNFRVREESILAEDSRDVDSFLLDSDGGNKSKLMDETKHTITNNRVSKPISLFGLFEDPMWTQDQQLNRASQRNFPGIGSFLSGLSKDDDSIGIVYNPSQKPQRKTVAFSVINETMLEVDESTMKIESQLYKSDSRSP